MKQKISQLMLKKYINTKYQLPDYNADADFEWIQSNSKLPWLQLNIDVPHAMIHEEIQKVESRLIQHRDDYSEHQGWRSFCIHGKSFDAIREEEYYNDTRPYVWTDLACEYLPATVKYFSTVWPGCGFARIRIMLLEPNGYITVHSDYTQAELRPINIAITQPVGCDFVMEHHGTVPFEAGSAFWMDVSNQHTVFNNSKHPRWHIIVHQSFDNVEFQDLVVNSYQTLYNQHNETMHNTN